MSQTSKVSFPARHDSFECWFQTPLGRALLASQRSCVDEHISGLTGARLLQVGLSHRLPLTANGDFSQKVLTTPAFCPHLPDGVAVCDADELPFPGDSMDLVILHHTADFSPHPHQVLREAARVLRGGGNMLLIGFNPLSLWGARRMLSRSRSGPWGGRFLLQGRMEDWLALLDFEVETTCTRFYRPPMRRFAVAGPQTSSPVLRAIGLLPVGAYYCILATKRVGAPVRRLPVWRKQAIKLPGTVGISRHGVNRSSRGMSVKEEK